MRFGPAGNSQKFYDEGYKSSEQAPEWIASQGLSAYEYAAGHGVSLGETLARKIGAKAAQVDVAVSIHAPYYINCAAVDEQKRANTFRYFLESARAVSWMGGRRVIFHPGSSGKLPREEAVQRVMKTFLEIRAYLDDQGFEQVILCPETMGRVGQLGTLDEVLTLCEADERALPTLDFGHLHTVGLGALNSEEDFEKILKTMVERLGFERVKHFHAHFSRIEFGPKGEKQHRCFYEQEYGPDFTLLAPVLVEMGLEPVIICESAGTQAPDAQFMRDRIALERAKRSDRAM